MFFTATPLIVARQFYELYITRRHEAEADDFAVAEASNSPCQPRDRYVIVRLPPVYARKGRCRLSVSPVRSRRFR